LNWKTVWKNIDMKKHLNKFTISFDSENPEHLAVMNILNSMERSKADYIAKAIDFYEKNIESNPSSIPENDIDELNHTNDLTKTSVNQLFNNLKGFRK